jgi:hypothetical protein
MEVQVHVLKALTVNDTYNNKFDASRMDHHPDQKSEHDPRRLPLRRRPMRLLEEDEAKEQVETVGQTAAAAAAADPNSAAALSAAMALQGLHDAASSRSLMSDRSASLRSLTSGGNSSRTLDLNLSMGDSFRGLINEMGFSTTSLMGPSSRVPVPQVKTDKKPSAKSQPIATQQQQQQQQEVIDVDQEDEPEQHQQQHLQEAKPSGVASDQGVARSLAAQEQQAQVEGDSEEHVGDVGDEAEEDQTTFPEKVS